MISNDISINDNYEFYDTISEFNFSKNDISVDSLPVANLIERFDQQKKSIKKNMRIGSLIEKDPTYLQALLNKKTREDLFKIRKINDGKISSNIFDTKTAKNLPNSKDENEETKRSEKISYENYETKIDISLFMNEKFKTWPVKATLDFINNCEEKPMQNKINITNINKSYNYENQNKREKYRQSPSKSHSFDSGQSFFNSNLDEVQFTAVDNSKLVDDKSEDFNIKNESIFIETIDEFINPVDKQIAAITSAMVNNDHSNHQFNFKQNAKRHKMSKTNLNSDITFSDENEKELKDSLFNEIYKDCDKENYFVKIHKIRENDQLKTDSSSNDNNSQLSNDQNKIISTMPSNKDYNENEDIKSSSNSESDLNLSKLDTLGIDVTKLSIKNKTKQGLKKVFNKFGRAVKHVQNKAEEVLSQEKDNSESDTETVNEATKTVKYKASRSNKSSHEFDKTQIIQLLNPSISQPSSNDFENSSQYSHKSNSIIWSMKFSSCGRLLSTAGKDQLIRIWVLNSYYHYFIDLIKENNKNSIYRDDSFMKNKDINDDQSIPFYPKPLMIYNGHKADILDVSWSKNLFILSASSDKLVKLWHIYKYECLCSFHHSSIVSSISFHPKDDRYFISACLDGKLRLWNISDKKVILWNDLNNLSQSSDNFITAISFCQGGKTIAVGTYDGKCILYHTEQLKYYSLINVKSTRGRNSKGSKITGIEVLNADENKILITSNDSRIRLYDLRDLSLVCKYKGFSNSTVHIKASLSADDKYIISGSKNKCTYFWRTNYQFSMLNSGRRDRNWYWERIQAHNSIVTCALFSPKPQLVINEFLKTNQLFKGNSNTLAKSKSLLIESKGSLKGKKNYPSSNTHVFVSAAGCDGIIKVFVN